VAGTGTGTGTGEGTEPANPESAHAAGGAPDLISDREFEDLLDQLHGRGKGPTVASAKAKGGPPKAEVAAEARHEEANLGAPKPRNADAPTRNRDTTQTAAPSSAAANQAETTVRVD